MRKLIESVVTSPWGISSVPSEAVGVLAAVIILGILTATTSSCTGLDTNMDTSSGRDTVMTAEAEVDVTAQVAAIGASAQDVGTGSLAVAGGGWVAVAPLLAGCFVLTALAFLCRNVSLSASVEVEAAKGAGVKGSVALEPTTTTTTATAAAATEPKRKLRWWRRG